ncbi:pentatricopeptide repeat-containing protein [Salix suchowensis]|nr:pentatricopeptide repeat-containing protein [Salix suchowensis]
MIYRSLANTCVEVLMWRLASHFLGKTSLYRKSHPFIHFIPLKSQNQNEKPSFFVFFRCIYNNSASRPSLSIWRRKKEMAKEGLIAAKELKRLQSNPVRLDRFIKSNVSRLLRSDLVAVLAELQRQDQVFLCMKLYNVVRKEIWYRPDMFFFRDMLMMLARNKKVDEAKQVWQDLKREEVLFDQHTFGDIMRAFLDNGLPSEAMGIYEEMRQSPDPPLSLPFRVILKGLIPFPELREQVKDDFLELFPDMIVYDPAEDLFGDQDSGDD